jgi:RimJ/RimL family protein N-acetyltransferase
MEIALRPAKVGDAEVMTRWFTDAVDLARWAGPEADFPLSGKQMAAWLAERNSVRPRHSFTALDRSGAAIGHFQLLHDPINETVRIGRFGISPERRGAGFGTALFARAVAMAFGEFRAYRVELGVFVDNAVARRLYERAGFVHEGIARDATVAGGKRWSVSTMSLLRPDWEVSAKPEAAA